MDFIFMLTRNDRTIENAASAIEYACDLGVRHIGFKDVGVSPTAMRELTQRIRARGGISYLEVVSTSADSVLRSLELGRSLGVDRILGGTDLAAANRVLGELSRYFPFPGTPVGHPTRLEGTAALVAEHCRSARASGCGGVDLLAYRATEAEPLDLVRAARRALPDATLIVAGSVHSPRQIRDLAQAGVDAFTVGAAVFDRSFSPVGGSVRDQLRDIISVCEQASRSCAE